MRGAHLGRTWELRALSFMAAFAAEGQQMEILAHCTPRFLFQGARYSDFAQTPERVRMTGVGISQRSRHPGGLRSGR
jgi:hypothetical protein